MCKVNQLLSIQQVHSSVMYQQLTSLCFQKRIFYIWLSLCPQSYFHCCLLFYSASLEHHSAFLPTQETLSSHFSNTHFFSFNKSLACFTVFLEHRVRSSCYFFFQLFIPKYIPCYFTLEAYIIFFHP